MSLFLLIFFLQRGHLGLTLIQLELLSLYLLHVILFRSLFSSATSIGVFLLLCVIASEAALGLSFLVVSSRQRSVELEKFNL